MANASEYPYSCIGVLIVNFPTKGACTGTAYMISPDVAVTAGHVLYDEENGEWATAAMFLPGVSGTESSSSAPYGMSSATEIAVSTQWFDNHNDDYDWGVIKLNSDIGDECGYLGIYYISRLNAVGYNVTVSGYPFFEEGDYNQYKHSGTLAEIPEHEIARQPYVFRYRIDASNGQSGAPILYRTDNIWYAVGQHTESDLLSYYSYGTRYTDQLYSFLIGYGF